MIGGHGKVALLAAPLLVEAGHEVVSLIRNPDQADDVAAAGAIPLVLSVEEADVAELAQAFAGADAIVWPAGAGGKGGPERTDAVDRAAAIAKIAADRHPQTTDLDWTILGPGLLTLDEPTGAITVARVLKGTPSSKAPTSRGNVARVIVAVLAEPASIGKVIPFYDGDTPIAQAVTDAPQEYADLS
jgi:NAD dependent sugar epimerase/dehydratase family protein